MIYSGFSHEKVVIFHSYVNVYQRDPEGIHHSRMFISSQGSTLPHIF